MEKPALLSKVIGGIAEEGSQPQRFRAGRYVRQAGGYDAYLPAPLPPAPPLEIDGETWRLLSDADRALGRLDAVTQTLPDTNLFLLMYVRKEALLSSQIEGTQASLEDIIRYEDKIEEADNPDDVEEVVSYIRALNWGLERLKHLPVSLRLIREIHAELMHGVRGQNKSPGEFRRVQNWIGPPGSSLQTAQFVPPAPQDLNSVLGQLESFIHTEADLPLLCQIGMIHAQFETIHPFLDGNGRLGRLLITLLLCEKGVLKEPSLYISYHFRQNKSEYYERLHGIRDRGDWESWIKYFLRGVRDVGREGANTASEILHLRERHRRILSESLSHALAGSAFKLIDHLYQTPIISVQRASEVIGRTYANANTLIQRLVELGILEETTGRERGRRYRYSPYVDLFRD